MNKHNQTLSLESEPPIVDWQPTKPIKIIAATLDNKEHASEKATEGEAKPFQEEHEPSIWALGRATNKRAEAKKSETERYALWLR